MTRPAGWPLLFALALGAFAIGTAEFSGMSLLPFYAREWGLDQPTAVRAVSLYALGVVVGAPVLALATARIGRVAAATGLIVAVALANLGTVAAKSFGLLLVFRFLSGVPHGAFFGQAALIAAAVVPARRAQTVALVMTGLTVATVIGAPVANLLGQTVGWRAGFAVAALAAAVSALLLLVLPHPDVPAPTSDPRDEIAGLRSAQLWLTLATGAVGFGGLFAVYAFLPTISERSAGLAPHWTPWILALFGLGALIGNIGAGWAGDRAPAATAIGLLGGSAVVLALLPIAASTPATFAPLLFGIALNAGLGPVLQTRLMDVAGEAQTLAAMLHHAAFNLANALGPWLAGMAIAATGQWTVAGPVGAALSLAGLAVFLVATRAAQAKRRK